MPRNPEIRFNSYIDDWEQRKVGDFYDFKNGLNKGKEFFGSGTPIVNFTDVFHNRGIISRNLNGKVTLEPSEIKNYEVKKGDIFFTRTSETIEEIGYPSVMLDEPANTVFSGFVLRGRCILNEDPLDDLFKKYVFFTDSFRNEMLKKSSMTTRALTSGTAIKGMEFSYPSSKGEQHKIGEFITNLDNLITLYQRMYEKLVNVKQSMLVKMFPREGSKIPEIRFEGFVYDWEQRKLSELGEIVTGSTPSTTKPEYYSEDGIPWVTPTDIDACTISETPRKLSEAGAKIGRVVPANTILCTCIASIGKNTLLTVNGSFNQQINGLTPFEGNDAYFLLTESELWSNQMKRMAASGTMQIVNKTEFSELLTWVPKPEEQKKIGEYFSNLDNLITLHLHKVDKLVQIKKSLLYKMFIQYYC